LQEKDSTMMNRFRCALLVAVFVGIATVAHGQVLGPVVVNPSAVAVTVDDRDVVMAFHLALYADLTTGNEPLATATPVAQLTVLKPPPSGVLGNTFTLGLAQLLTSVGPADRLIPLLLWIRSENSLGQQGPAILMTNGQAQAVQVQVLPSPVVLIPHRPVLALVQ
jgi:hypothetical protein